MITQEYLKERFHYNPETGVFTYLRNTKHRNKGDIFGSIHKSTGYLRGSVGKYNDMFLHRLAYLYMTGELPTKGMHIDHINHDKTDNRWENIRLANPKANARNREGYNSHSGVLGVRWNKADWLWMVSVGTEHIGSYKTMEEAASAREAALKERNYHKNHGKKLL